MSTWNVPPLASPPPPRFSTLPPPPVRLSTPPSSWAPRQDLSSLGVRLIDALPRLPRMPGLVTGFFLGLAAGAALLAMAQGFASGAADVARAARADAVTASAPVAAAPAALAGDTRPIGVPSVRAEDLPPVTLGVEQLPVARRR